MRMKYVLNMLYWDLVLWFCSVWMLFNPRYCKPSGGKLIRIGKRMCTLQTCINTDIPVRNLPPKHIQHLDTKQSSHNSVIMQTNCCFYSNLTQFCDGLLR